MSARLERLFNTVLALEHPGALRLWLTSTAFYAPCLRLNSALKRQQSHFATILDVGANAGQFAVAAALHFPDARIYAFEPLPEVYRELCRNLRHHHHVVAFNWALGRTGGRLAFNRNAYSRLSSALAIASGNRYPRYRERNTRAVEVAVERLDDCARRLDLVPPVLLKMDVQGMEKEVLLGASRTLERIDFLLYETALVPLYQNQPLFDEMHRFTVDLGYRLRAPLTLNQSRSGIVIEMDVLYEKAPLGGRESRIGGV